MPSGVYFRTDENRRNISKAKMGALSPRKGVKLSDDTKAKLRRAHTGLRASEETRKKMSVSHMGNKSNSGKCLPEEVKKKISDSLKGDKNPMFGKHPANVGMPRSEEIRKKISESKSGENHPFFGKQLSEEYRVKLVESHTDGFWYGAVRYYTNPQYCEKWTPNLRERVRAYRGYICFECGTPQNGHKLHVHHVHYNKRTCCDNSPRDLVPLCESCHAKTNTNRGYWEDHFTEMIYALDPINGKCFLSKEEMKNFRGRDHC